MACSGKVCFRVQKTMEKRYSSLSRLLSGFSHITEKSPQNPLLSLSLSSLKACLLPTEAFLEERFSDFRGGIQSSSLSLPFLGKVLNYI